MTDGTTVTDEHRAMCRKISRTGKDALDLAHRLGGTIWAGSHVLQGRVHWVNSGTLRVLIKLRLVEAATDNLPLVDGTVPLTVRLTDKGRKLAEWRVHR